MTVRRDDRPHVVIVGGGFGGLEATRHLRKAPVRVTLVDRRNHHLFQPLLYQVATAALNPSDIAHPLRATLRRQENVEVLLGEAMAIDVGARTVTLDRGELAYDYLILATGATHSYFGHDEWAEHAPGLKSIEDALEIRRRVLLAYEAAEREEDPERVDEWMTFVVVGAGPTGVELAGALAEISRHALCRDFRSIDPRSARIVLVEAADRVLLAYSDPSGKRAVAQLEELGVEVRTGSMVTGVDDTGVQLSDGRIAARTVLWAAGVRASRLARSLGSTLDRAGRVCVKPDLSLPGHPEVFVIGDLCQVPFPEEVPGIAPAAMQEGRHVARLIRRELGGHERTAFHYRDKGQMATIGRGAAVVERGRLRLSGVVAWLMWMAVHIYFLIGFRNRLFVMLSWAWSYLTFRRGARLITGNDYPPLPAVREDVQRADEIRREGDGHDREAPQLPP